MARENRSDRAFNMVNYLILTAFFLMVLYPLLYVVAASFSAPIAVITGRVWLLPVEPNLEGYKAVFRHKLIKTGYMNSFFYASVGTAVNVFMTVLAAYPLSRRDMPGRNLVMFAFAFTMMFSGGLIPTYLLVRNLGLLDTRTAMILPTAVGVWQVIIARTYFQSTLPPSLLEASRIDGCSDFRFVAAVVLPLSGPIIAVISLFYAVAHWNAFFNALIYLTTPSKYPLQLVLRDVLIQNEMDLTSFTDIETLAAKENLIELLKYSLIVVASLPIIMVYPFIQRYFVKGIMIGAIKG